MARKPLALLLALVLTAALAACSSSSSDGGARTTTTASTRDTSQDPGHISTSTTLAFDGGTRREYVTQLEAGLADGSEANGDLVLSATQAACVAPVWIDTITVSALTAKRVAPKALSSNSYDFTKLGLSTGQATTMVAAFSTCHVDVVSLLAKAMAAGQSADKQACIKANLDAATTSTLLIQALAAPSGSAGTALQARLQAIARTCNLG